MYVLVAIVLFLIIFLILREFWCWFFKFNKLVTLMEEQNKLLTELKNRNNT
jgi:hypothetical protein